MKRQYEFNTTQDGKALCDEIVDVMMSRFGIAEAEAVGRVNRRWKGIAFEEEDLRSHETAEFWASDIYFGADSYWWTNPTNLIPATVRERLGEAIYTRRDVAAVTRALQAIVCELHPSIRAFYERYEGPFGSDTTGFELLDLVEGNPNVLSQSQAAREVHHFDERYLVLTEPLGNAVLVLDGKTSEVYNVDFEGSDAALRAGALKPDWPSFNAFLEEYFGAAGAR